MPCMVLVDLYLNLLISRRGWQRKGPQNVGLGKPTLLQ